MKTQRACAVTSPSPERAVHRVAIVGPRRELDGVPLAEAPWPGVLVDRVADEAFDNYLDRLGGETLAVVVVVAEAGDRGPLRILRSRPERLRTRAYILARAPARLLSPVEDDWDVEGIVDLDRLAPEALARAVENGLRAYRALGRTR